MSAPLLLALDTSTAVASLALFDGQQVLSETTWLAGREHSTRLLTEVDIALERVGKRADDLTGLVVARGPGSFTGVRVALSVAKGMAAALSLPAWGVSSLDALGLAAGEASLPVRAVVAAGRGRYATALYANGAEVEPPRLMTLEDLIQTLDRPTLVTGELTRDARDTLGQIGDIRLGPLASGARRAGFVAELGWRMAQAGDRGNPAALDAIYLS